MEINLRECAISGKGKKPFTFASHIPDISPRKTRLREAMRPPLDRSAMNVRFGGRKGKKKMKVKVVPADQRLKFDDLDQRGVDDLNQFIERLAFRQSRPYKKEVDPQMARHTLNPNSRAKLENWLWCEAVKAMQNYRAGGAPILQYVKTVLKPVANRQARIILNGQVERGEPDGGELSLDAELPGGDDGSDSYVDLLPEDAELVRLVGLRDYIAALMCKLGWAEQMALGTLMYEDRTKVAVAEFLGISRPTLDALIRKATRQLLEAAKEILYTGDANRR